jgi:hypothetical protein
MAVAYVPTVFSSTTGTSPQSVTLPAGSDRIAIFSFHCEASGSTTPATLSAVTYGAGAQALTFIGRETYVGGVASVETVELWYLAETHMLGGANDFAWTIGAGASSTTRVSVTTFSGVNQTTPVNTFIDGSFTATTTPTALSVTNLAGGGCAVFTTLTAQSITHDWSANSFTEIVDASMSTVASRSIAYKIADGEQTATLTLSASASGAQILVSLNPVGAGTPVLDVTGVSGLNYLGTATATGVDFGASTGSVTLGGVMQTPTSWTDTSVSFTVDRGTSRYGAVSIALTRQDGTSSDSIDATLSPQTGWSRTDLVGTLADSGVRITALPDLATGDQLAYGNVQGMGTPATGTYGVEVFADGSYAADAWVEAFDVEAHDGVEWGGTSTQTLGAEAEEDAPVEGNFILTTVAVTRQWAGSRGRRR